MCSHSAWKPTPTQEHFPWTLITIATSSQLVVVPEPQRAYAGRAIVQHFEFDSLRRAFIASFRIGHLGARGILWDGDGTDDFRAQQSVRICVCAEELRRALSCIDPVRSVGFGIRALPLKAIRRIYSVGESGKSSVHRVYKSSRRTELDQVALPLPMKRLRGMHALEFAQRARPGKVASSRGLQRRGEFLVHLAGAIAKPKMRMNVAADSHVTCLASFPITFAPRVSASSLLRA